MVKTGASTETEGEKLQKAYARITRLTKENAVLTELSNRWKSELLKSGYHVKRPGVETSQSPNRLTQPPPSNPITSPSKKPNATKLDKLEELQYQLTKKGFNHQNKKSDSEKLDSELGPKIATSKTAVPSIIDSTSTSGSVLMPLAKPSNMATRTKKPAKYQVPPPVVSKLKSNVAWIPKEKPTSSSPDPPISKLSNSNAKGEGRESLGVIDSMDLGSSIQEVWRLLDEQPSLGSSHSG